MKSSTLIPDAKAEEEGLYAGVAELLGDKRSIAPMIYDHRAICERTVELASASVADVPRLQELLYGLHALIEVHFRKEEDLQLPAFDAAPPEITEAVIARMERATGHDHEHLH